MDNGFHSGWAASWQSAISVKEPVSVLSSEPTPLNPIGEPVEQKSAPQSGARKETEKKGAGTLSNNTLSSPPSVDWDPAPKTKIRQRRGNKK